MAGGVRTSVLDAGEGEPLVALHGIPTSSELFAPLLPALDGFRLLAPDLLGQGETEAPQGPLDHGAYARHLEAFLGESAPPSFHLLVHDFGGVLGLAWAAEHADRLKKLVVLSTTAAFSLRWAALCAAIYAFELAAGAAGLRRGMERTVKRRGALAPALAERWARPWTRARVLRGVDHFSRRHLDALAAKLPAIRAPALLLWGEEDDIFPRAHAQQIAAQLPNAQLRTIPGAGHWSPLDAPDEVGRAVAEFLRR